MKRFLLVAVLAVGTLAGYQTQARAEGGFGFGIGLGIGFKFSFSGWSNHCDDGGHAHPGFGYPMSGPALAGAPAGGVPGHAVAGYGMPGYADPAAMYYALLQQQYYGANPYYNPAAYNTQLAAYPQSAYGFPGTMMSAVPQAAPTHMAPAAARPAVSLVNSNN